jgi:hydroxypyruvate isomerase
MPRFSANLHFLFGEYPFMERFAAAKDAGFSAVEFPDPYSQDGDALAAQLSGLDLQCVLMNLPMGRRDQGEMGIACLPDRTEEFRAGVARAIEAGRRLHCPRFNCLAGRRPPGADPALLRRTLLENLRHAARAFAEHGLFLTVEPINTHDTPGFFLDGSAVAVDLIRELDERNLELQFDCYHLHRMGEELFDSARRLLPVIGHIQVSDVPGRHEPGSGVIDYPGLFAHLDAIGYRGWVGAEYHPSRRTEETLHWMPGRAAQRG